MKYKIKQLIAEAIKKLYPEVADFDFSVDYAPANIDADFASNVAMVLAKKLGRKPMDVAGELAATVGAAAVPPGFLNFRLPQDALFENLRLILAKKDDYGRPAQKVSGGKTLMEYFQPNIAKPLHVGHMRSAIIGDCLYRLEKFLGRAVESDTHMGDWGTQFGLLLYAYKQWGDDAVIEKDPINELNKLYVRINEEIEKKPKLREAGKAEFVKLEQGDRANHALWKKFVKWSMERFLRINDLLDISEFDHHWPESFYEDKMPAALQRLEQEGFLKESEGARVVDLSSHKLGTAIMVKSDGATTYLLRDLATFLYRKHEQKFARQIYVVDNRQSHHFQQLFQILELLGERQPDERVHADFGFMSLPEGAMSTRKGNIVELETVVAKAIDKAKQIIAEKNPDLKNADKVARAVAIGALKYFDLSHNRKSDIVFTWDKALAFEGNTGPYLQYTHARLCSILRKAGKISKPAETAELGGHEMAILRKFMNFADTVSAAADEFAPNILTGYLYELADAVNSFYHAVPVLPEKEETLRNFRINLVVAAAQVLKNGLSLLGIAAPEEM